MVCYGCSGVLASAYNLGSCFLPETADWLLGVEMCCRKGDATTSLKVSRALLPLNLQPYIHGLHIEFIGLVGSRRFIGFVGF